VQITALKASNSNTANTVLRLFNSAVQKYGFPGKVRGDRGGENLEVAVAMIKYRGKGVKAFIYGTYVL
jgi:hypothetical protein